MGSPPDSLAPRTSSPTFLVPVIGSPHPCLGPPNLAPYLCPQQSEEDVSQFDVRFTRQTPVDSPDDSALSESADQAFLVREQSDG